MLIFELMSRNLTLQINKNDDLDITVYGEDKTGVVPCIIVIHGFKGFKDWGFFPHTGKHLADKGFFVITFNFSHNGVGRDSLDFNEPGKFADNSVSKQLNEVNLLIESYYSGFFGEVKNKNLGLLGHSLGGGIAVLTGASNPDVKAVTGWNAASTFDRFSSRQKKEWEENGFTEVTNSRTGQVLRINSGYLKDLEENGSDRLNVIKAAGNLNGRLLLIQAKEDLAVNPKEAEKIKESAGSKLEELVWIKSAGHTFNIVHPFDGSNEMFDEVLYSTYKFFEKQLF